MKINRHKYNRGFIALMLVITISSLLLVFSFMQFLPIAHFFDQTITKKYRLMNYYNAYSCIDQAILNLAHDYFYRVYISVDIPYLNCSIVNVKKEDEVVMIETRGNYKGINVSRKAIIRLYDDRLVVVLIE